MSLLKAELPMPSAGQGLRYFESLHHLEGRRFTSLESARELLALLGDPQNLIPAIHVAGTNGKGTVCAILAAILHSTGAAVGQTVSPHLVDVRERCLINGQPQDAVAFGAAVEHVVQVAHAAGIAPGYFVLGVLASFYEFSRLKLDWMVVEVGLGGVSDATNTIAKPRATAITSIGLDHTELLGDSLAEIAAKKAGILRKDVPVILGEMPEAARLEIARIAAEVGAPIFAAGEEFYYDAARKALIYSHGSFALEPGQLALSGRYQFRNALVAIRVALQLGIPERAVYEGLRRVRWPGRLEESSVVTPSGAMARVLTDVCHNPDGVRALVEHLDEQLQRGTRQLSFLLSIVDRKDWRAMLEQFKQFKSAVEARGASVRMLFTSSGSPAAVLPEQLCEYFGAGEVFQDPAQALHAALSGAGRDSLIVVTGSVFLAGRLRPLLTDEPFRSIAS